MRTSESTPPLYQLVAEHERMKQEIERSQPPCLILSHEERDKMAGRKGPRTASIERARLAYLRKKTRKSA